jgi:hypothetical protein
MNSKVAMSSLGAAEWGERRRWKACTGRNSSQSSTGLRGAGLSLALIAYTTVSTGPRSENVRADFMARNGRPIMLSPDPPVQPAVGRC